MQQGCKRRVGRVAVKDSTNGSLRSKQWRAAPHLTVLVDDIAHPI